MQAARIIITATLEKGFSTALIINGLEDAMIMSDETDMQQENIIGVIFIFMISPTIILIEVEITLITLGDMRISEMGDELKGELNWITAKINTIINVRFLISKTRILQL